MRFTIGNFFGEETVVVNGVAKYLDYEPHSEWEGSCRFTKESFPFEYEFLDHSFDKNWRNHLIDHLKEVLPAEGCVKRIHLKELRFSVRVEDESDSESHSDDCDTDDD